MNMPRKRGAYFIIRLNGKIYGLFVFKNHHCRVANNIFNSLVYEATLFQFGHFV